MYIGKVDGAYEARQCYSGEPKKFSAAECLRILCMYVYCGVWTILVSQAVQSDANAKIPNSRVLLPMSCLRWITADRHIQNCDVGNERKYLEYSGKNV